MGIRDWFRRGRSADEPSFPVDLPIYPGRLSMRVHDHVLETMEGKMACWSFVSQGLASSGHREVVITIRREAGEAATQIPFGIVGSYFASLLAFAEQGCMVQEWGISAFDEPIFWGRRGVIYAPVLNLPNVEVPNDALAGIVVHDDELEHAERCGPGRVLALLGLAAHHYPWPPWYDRRRECVPIRPSVENGLLSAFPTLPVLDGVATMESGNVTVDLPMGTAAVLSKILPRMQAPGLVLGLTMDPRADNCRVFNGTDLGVIAPFGSQRQRSALLMLWIVRRADADEFCGVEDGVGLKLTADTWVGLERALMAAEPWTHKFGDLEFRVRWNDEPLPARAERWIWGRTKSGP